MGILIRNIAFCLVNLRICDLRTGTPRNFCGFAIVVWTQEIADFILNISSDKIISDRYSPSKASETEGSFL